MYATAQTAYLCSRFEKEPDKHKVQFVISCKVWVLKEDETAGIFRERVQTRAALVVEEPGNVESVWKNFKDYVKGLHMGLTSNSCLS